MLGSGEHSVKRVRVLVANHPRLMRELVMATIADQPDIEVVGEVQSEGDLAGIVEQVEPDVLIVTKMRNKASRSKRFSASKKTAATGPENSVKAAVPIR